jgi:hypothetical protein
MLVNKLLYSFFYCKNEMYWLRFLFFYSLHTNNMPYDLNNCILLN